MRKLLVLAIIVLLVPALAFGQASLKGEDQPHTSGDVGNFILGVRNDTPSSLCGTDADYCPIAVDQYGQLKTTGEVSMSSEQIEDAAHTSGDSGVLNLTVRKDTAASTSGADGDYAALTTTSDGKLWIAGVEIEDESIPGPRPLVVIGGGQLASPSTGLAANGDWTYFYTNPLGMLWTAAIGQGDRIVDGTDYNEVKHAAINIDGADSDQVVAALASQKVKVLGYTVVCDGATTITFEDGDGTDVSGSMALAANGGISAAVSLYGQFETPVVNKSLNILKSAAVNCDGHLTYMYVD